MAGDISPEERLLRLIRNKTPKDNKGVPAVGALSPRTKKTIVSKNLLSIFKIFSFKRISVILSILVILLAAYSVFVLLAPQPSLNLNNIQEITPADKSTQQSAVISPPRPYSYYSGKIETRDIFSAPFLLDSTSDTSLDSSLGRRVADLTLVGIVLDDIPQAIVEDKKENRTYFLNKGDYLGDIKVEDISENKVILLYGGEEFELVP